MIGSFTYETIEFNPTFVIIAGVVVTLVIAAFVWIVTGSDEFSSENAASGAFLIAVIGAVVIFLTVVLPEGFRVEDFKTDSVEQNREATFAQLGYTEVQPDGDMWSASYNGEYASGSLKLIEDKQTYEIYKFESK